MERVSDDQVTLQLINLDPVEEKVEVPVNHSHVTVRLAPGAGTRLRLSVDRYANQPTFAFPWV